MTTLAELKAAFAAGYLSKPDFIASALPVHAQLFAYAEALGVTDVQEVRLSREGVCFTIGAQRLRLWCPPGESRVAPIEIMNFDGYESHETGVLDRLARDARVILDIGANIGWHAVRWAVAHPAAQVFAFEPLPEAQRYLQRNIAANGVGDRCTAFHYGLSKTSGAAAFHLAPAQGTNASLCNVAGTATAQEVVGLTMRLDDWVQAHRVVPDFIKCDVEGAEWWVFQGGEETLKTHKPAIFTELLRKWSRPFGYHPNDMLAWFAELGYVAIAVGAAGPRRIVEVTEETLETNYALLHPEVHGELLRDILGAPASQAV